MRLSLKHNVCRALAALVVFFGGAFAEAGDIVFGPEDFFSVDAELTATTRVLDLGDNQPGTYLLKIQNGVNGPQLLQQCAGLTPIELKRQCQFDNIIDSTENKIFRVNKLFVTINGVKVSTKTLVNKATAYLEFPVLLGQQINNIKVEVQADPDAFVSLSFEEVNVSTLPPKALFTLNSNHGKAPYKFKFNAAPSFDPMNSPITYEWFLNNQSISTAESGDTTIATAGNYSLKLKVTNGNQLTDELEASLVVLTPAQVNPATNKKPIPVFTMSNPNPAFLRLVRLSAEGSMDPDGNISSFKIDFGDGFIANTPVAFHAYQTDGTYLAKLTLTDNLGAKVTVEKSISVVGSNELVPDGVFFDHVYEGSLSPLVTYNDTFQIPPELAQDLFRITVLNAGGNEYPITTPCTGTLPQKIMCQYYNVLSRAGIEFDRVKSAQVFLNNKKITDSKSMNNTKAVFSTVVKLQQLNALKVKIKGWPSSYALLKVERLVSSADHSPPVIHANIQSGALTNISTFHVSVTDNAAITTEVYKEGVLVNTLSDKEFDLSLTEGNNNYVIKSQDQYGNIAQDLNLFSVHLDSTPPPVISNLTAGVTNKFYYNSFPQTVMLSFYSTEEITGVTVDGVAATFNPEFNVYQFPLTFTQASVQTLHVEVEDLASNVTSQNYSVRSILDITPPVITLTNVPTIIIDSSYLLPIKITESYYPKTVVEIDGEASAPTTEKNFSYLIEFPEDETKTIKITSTDAAGNVASKTIQIKRDTSPLAVQFVSPVAGSEQPSQTVQVQLVSNKPISNVRLNGVLVPVNTDQISVTANINLHADGQYSFTAIVNDVFGGSVTTTVNFTVKTRSIASWSYEECPAPAGE